MTCVCVCVCVSTYYVYTRRLRAVSKNVRLKRNAAIFNLTFAVDAGRHGERHRPIRARVRRVINGVESIPLKRDARLLFQTARNVEERS